MTEDQWLAATEPDVLLRALVGIGNPTRLAHLYAVACCLRVRDRLSDPARRMIDAIEATLDEEADWSERSAKLQGTVLGGPLPVAGMANRAVERLYSRFFHPLGPLLNWSRVRDTLSEIARLARQAVGKRGMPGWEAEAAVQAVLLRDIFTHSDRPMLVLPAWLTPTVLALAEGIYADRTFDRLPILADALQDAGCDDPDVLGHCRSEGPHVRGCWVVDLVLGKG
jgi:hypothetical protein